MRILVIDSLEVVYEGVKSHFVKHCNDADLNWCKNLQQAENLMKSNKYDLIISELDFEEVDGLDILESLYKRFRINLTLHTSKRNEFRLKWFNEISFINHVCYKEDGIQNILRSIGSYPCKPQVKSEKNSNLSKREEEVLNFVIQGFTNKIIASRLQLSDKTVATYKHRLLKKLGLNSDYELFAIQRKTGSQNFSLAS